jgi:hypothetical protein
VTVAVVVPSTSRNDGPGAERPGRDVGFGAVRRVLVESEKEAFGHLPSDLTTAGRIVGFTLTA